MSVLLVSVALWHLMCPLHVNVIRYAFAQPFDISLK
jgi:hypothetical protein